MVAGPSAGSRFLIAIFCGLNGPVAWENVLDEVTVYRRALAHLRAGEAGQAAAALRLFLQHRPTDTAGRQMLAMAVAGQGDFLSARVVFAELAQEQPGLPDAWINLGNACLQCGDATAAAHAFGRAQALGSDDVAYLLGHGLALQATEQYSRAERLLARALLHEPNAADVRLAYAQCLAELERFDEIAPCIDDLDPALLTLEQQCSLAWVRAQAGRDEQALQLYQSILQAQPQLHEARLQLVVLLERLNRVDEAARQLQQVPVLQDSITPMFRLASMRVTRRQGNAALALSCMRGVCLQSMPQAMRAQLLFETAKCHEQVGAADAVMQSLAQAHAAARVALLQRHPQLCQRDPLGWLAQRLASPAAQEWCTPAVDALPRDPVFLVGFPRSGTTLLERMLDAHGQLQVMDERPVLEQVISLLQQIPGWDPDSLDRALAGLSTAQLGLARSAYWQRARRHVAGSARLVDKYPLSMTRVAHAARLFPAADWLLMLRHPCDVVLSCYMQAFGINGGALAFESLEATAMAYARVMQWWEQQHVLWPTLRLHVVRYEDLVQPPQAVLASLMAFLQLAVEPSQLQFHKAVRERSRRITTPSYAQVAQPLNPGAIDRWKRYRAHFSTQTLTVLEPWVRRYGYEL